MFLQSSSKHELLLQAADVEKLLDEDGDVSKDLFSLTNLKVLSVTNSEKILRLPTEIGNLKSLLSLTISKTKLKSIPETISSLVELRSLDLSFNEILTVPSTLTQCRRLQNLNLSHNRISVVPPMETGGGLDELRQLDLAHNALSDLSLLDRLEAFGLHELVVSFNVLTSLPVEIGRLTNVRRVDVSSNRIERLPTEMASCTKLKCLLVENNPLRDRRLAKLVASHGATKPKAVLEYLAVQEKKGGGSKKGKKSKGGTTAAAETASLPPPRAIISVLLADSTKEIEYSGTVSGVRAHIVCAIVKGFDLSDSDVFRRFISLQTDLHDGVCEKRRVATIATHDLASLRFPLSYEARSSDQLRIQPLGHPSVITAMELVRNLSSATRKTDHDLPYLGLKKYLSLLAGADLYPCLVDDDDNVVSFPPLTNCEKTKVTEETEAIFVEVTSSKSLASCRMVMDLLMSKLIDGDFTHRGDTGEEEEPDGEKESDMKSSMKQLYVEQCRIVTETGKTRNIYPSREDLLIDNVQIVRGQFKKH